MNLQVTVEITAVEFRRLNSFEWAVLSLLDTFQSGAPTIADATAQLCIGEPAFLGAALESMRSVDAVRPKTGELRRLDLNDYELSEAGGIILREDGWETGDEQSQTEHIDLDWPSLRLASRQPSGGKADRNKSGPSQSEVEARLTPERVEEWLNQNDDSRCWRVRKFYVTKVES